MAPTTWVPDRSLPVLFSQINDAAPRRRKDSDGLKGDAAHAKRKSEHNPEHPAPPGNPDYQVDAGDITHDPANGADMFEVTEAIRLSRDQRILYVIFNGRIFYSYVHNGVPAWTWQKYSGTDDHSGHAHISVNDVYHDETQPWAIGIDGMDTADKQQLTTVNWRILEGLIYLKDSVDDHVNKVPQTNQLALAIKRIEAGILASATRERLLAEALVGLTTLINAGGGDVELTAVMARIDARAEEELARDAEQNARIEALQTALDEAEDRLRAAAGAFAMEANPPK